jgi:multiple antibiotic resistance protein
MDLGFASLFEQFVTLWAVIDPVGTLPVFVATTAGMGAAAARRVALRAAGIAFGVLMLFLLTGQYVLEGLGTSLPAFQIAGGIVLFVFALSMIFGEPKPKTDLDSAGRGDVAVFPLAMPSLASPGAMLAVVMLTDNHRFSPAEQAVTAAITLLVILAAVAIMLAASVLDRWIGEAGAAIISRVMGMILAAVAVDAVLEALVAIGALPAL